MQKHFNLCDDVYMENNPLWRRIPWKVWSVHYTTLPCPQCRLGGEALAFEALNFEPVDSESVHFEQNSDSLNSMDWGWEDKTTRLPRSSSGTSPTTRETMAEDRGGGMAEGRGGGVAEIRGGDLAEVNGVCQGENQTWTTGWLEQEKIAQPGAAGALVFEEVVE